MTRPALAGARLWWTGARPRTLGAAVVPVAVGVAAAGRAPPGRTAGLLAVALGLQVGVNYANDYFDGVRGVDTAARRGPARLVGSGAASPRAVAAAAGISFTVAAAAGVALALVAGLPLLAIGAAAIAAALLYSGGPRPYASLGLGEVSVFAFFGLAATAGSAYVQTGGVPAGAWWASIPVGLLAVTILLANNLRDIPTDAAAGKRTLAVRLGPDTTRVLYAALVLAAFLAMPLGVLAGALPAATLLALAASPLAVPALRLASRGDTAALIGILGATVRLHLAAGGLLALGLWMGHLS